MAISLDTRLPLMAVGEQIFPQIQDAISKQQEIRKNALAQRLAEMKADYEARKIKRERQIEQMFGEELGRMTAGQPAIERTEYVWQQPKQVVEQAAIPPREATLDDMQRAGIMAMMRAGDLQGAFEAMKTARAGQAQQIKPFGGMTKTGHDGMEYAFNQATGKYEPTGFAAQPEQQKPRIQAIRTANGIQFVDLNKMTPGAVLPAPAAQPRPSRTQMVQDESGTYLIDLDNPSAPAVPVTKPGGAPIAKPKAGGGMPTEDERKAAGWFAQAENAWNNMQYIIKRHPEAMNQQLMERLLPEGAANVMRSEERQMFLQGARSLSEAALRAATGAGVNYEEARQKIEELTPVYGDKPGVIKQKLDSIKVYLASLKTRAGRAYTGDEQQTAGQRQEVDMLPPASQYKGKIATDQQTGQRYQSDGKTWRRIAK